MPGIYPVGRCGTIEFCRIAGLSKTTFFTKYRKDSRYIKQFDIRVDALQRLNMSRDAAEAFAKTRAGKLAHGNAGRAMQRLCPRCQAPNHNRRNTCCACGYLFRWPCPRCDTRTDAAHDQCRLCGTNRDAPDA